MCQKMKIIFQDVSSMSKDMLLTIRSLPYYMTHVPGHWSKTVVAPSCIATSHQPTMLRAAPSNNSNSNVGCRPAKRSEGTVINPIHRTKTTTPSKRNETPHHDAYRKTTPRFNGSPCKRINGSKTI